MKKYIVLIAILGSLLLIGCSSSDTNQKKSEDSYTFIDDLGREVTVQEPKRVAALIGSFAEMWQLAGGSVCATADDAWDDMDLELAKDTVNLGQTKNIRVEQLFASNPDFIIASANTRVNVEIKDQLEATQIPTAYFEVSGFEDYLRVLKIFTDITGREDLYQKNGLSVQKQIQSVIKENEKRLEGKEGPSVLFLRVSGAMVRAKGNKDTVLGEMLEALGCRNIADEDTSLLENLSLEHILQKNPDYIFTVQVGDDTDGVKQQLETLFSEDSVWSKLSAVKEDRWYHLEKRLYNLKPNARWGEAYEGLEKILAEE